jgi:hypothetical protein
MRTTALGAIYPGRYHPYRAMQGENMSTVTLTAENVESTSLKAHGASA